MAIYIDTSFLLSMLLDEETAVDLVPIWEQDETRLSSILLQAEALVSLRRSKAPAGAEAVLAELLREVALRMVDREIVQLVESERLLSGCRTLDALHLATALEFLRGASSNLSLCSLDRRMRAMARRLSMPVLPAQAPPV